MADLNLLSKIAFVNAVKREEADRRNNSVNTDEMLKHTAGEVVEALQAFNEWQEELKFGQVSMGVTDPMNLVRSVADTKQHFSSELADIICCVLIIAGRHNLDIEKAVLDCMDKNRKRAEGIGDKL